MKEGLTRSKSCPTCGADLIWTQNAWQSEDGSAAAAYSCANGHVVDPALTRQCPKCGVHDTAVIGALEGRQQFRCERCGETFTHPR